MSLKEKELDKGQTTDMEKGIEDILSTTSGGNRTHDLKSFSQQACALPLCLNRWLFLIKPSMRNLHSSSSSSSPSSSTSRPASLSSSSSVVASSFFGPCDELSGTSSSAPSGPDRSSTGGKSDKLAESPGGSETEPERSSKKGRDGAQQESWVRIQARAETYLVYALKTARDCFAMSECRLNA